LIVVDSSVWIANLRNIDGEPVRKLRAFVAGQDDQILVGDLVLLEILQGARDKAHAVRLERGLRRFEVASMLNDRLAVRVAEGYRALRERGITVRKTVDMIIGTFCIEGGHTLLHDDRDFEPMQHYLGLQVA